MKVFKNTKLCYTIVVSTIILFCAIHLNAQTIYTGPVGGDWFTPGNWSNGLPANGNNALIPGGASVTISGTPLVTDYNIDNFGSITLNGVTLTNGGSIYSGAVFNNNGEIINNQSFQNFGTLTCSGSFINNSTYASGGPWTINAGAIFTNNSTGSVNSTGAVTIDGLIENKGLFGQGNGFILNGDFKNYAGATFNNNFGANFNVAATATYLNEGNTFNDGDFINGGSINNIGTFRNNVNLVNQNSIVNNAAAQIQNYGTLTNNANLVNNSGATILNQFTLVNAGSINNSGSFENNNVFDNKVTGIYNNLTGATYMNQFGSNLTNAGSFTNDASFNSNGGINNSNVFVNNSVLNLNTGAVLSNTGQLTNNGTLTNANTINNNGTFINTLTLNNLSGGIVNNFSSFSNNLGAVINNNYEFYNKSASSFNNAGVVNNDVRFSNEGALANNGYLRSPGDLFNLSSGSISNNEIIEIAEGNLKNEGSISNNKTLKITACASLKNTATIQNNGLIQNKGLLFQFGTVTGNAIQTIGGYVHTNASSSVAPVCVPVTVSANLEGEAKVYANSMINLGGSNNCNSLVYLANGVARPVWHCADVGTMQVANVVVSTRIGDSLTCQSNVMVVDSLAPVFEGCPTPIYIQSVAANNTVNWTPPTATDNCTSTSMATTHTPGSVFQPGTTTVTYTATDLNGRSNQCQFTVNIQQVPGNANCTGDISGPAISNCPGNQTINTTGFSSTATWFPPSITDNCFPVAFTSNYSPGATFQLGSTPVVYTATDGNNNSATCVFNINVIQQSTPCASDQVKPVISNCPGNQFLITNTNTNGAYATWAAPFASDNCGQVVLSANNASGNFFPIGATSVTYTATDQSNNTSSCHFVINVGASSPCPGDVTGPVFSGCPANISLTTAGNSAVANWSAPTVSDACAPVIVNNNYSSGTSFPLGSTAVQYTASDNIGNTSQCSFNVAVQNICDIDQTNPVISGCPSNILIATTGSSAVATWTAPTATDNCTLQSFSSNYLSGVAFPVGTTIVVYTATDARGNVSNCNFSVTVANAPGCTTNTLPANNATDINPGSVALSWSPAVNATSYDVYLGTSSFLTSLVGSNVTTSTFTVTNLLGSTSYYWFIVPKNAAGSATGCSSNITKFTTSSSACTVCTGNLLPNGCFNDALNSYTVTGSTSIISSGAYGGTFAAELCGSSSTLVSNSPAIPAYQYKWSLYARTSGSSICGNLTMSFVNSSGVVISTAQPVTVTSTSYQLYTVTGVSPAGTATIRITAAKCAAAGCLVIDEMCLTGDVYCDNITNGGTITGTQPANCGPFDAPVINSSTLPTGGSGTIEYIWRSSTTGCPTATTGTIILGANGATYDPPFTTQTTYFIRLAKRSGCTNYIASNCVTYTVTTDNTAPVITNCPVNQNIGSSASCATATWITPTATDNCGTPFLTSNFNSGYCFPQGNTTVVYTATDAANISKTCSFVITVGAAGDNFCKGTPGTGLTREVWNNIAGASVINLTSNANYPNSPTSASLNAASIGPVNIADNYGTRVRGYITPATTGTYKFYVYGDDETQLFLSTNNQSANKVMIANVPGWTNVAELYKYTNQASANKTLTAGQNYYVELLQKEAGGGDHWGIYWIPPGTTTPVQIPLQFLAPISTNCTPPACATLVSPANNATDVSVTSLPLTWNSSATATSYDIYLATANPPTTIVASNVTGTSYNATNLQPGTAYFWYVVPKNANGSATGCNSTVFKFTTEIPCSNLTNGGTIAGTQPTNCGPFDAPVINSSALPTGGSGTIEYIWRSSTTSCPTATTGTIILGANGASYDPPFTTQTTYFIRLAKRSGCTNYIASNCVTYTVTTDNTAPVITNCPVNQNIGSSATCATATWITPTATDNCGSPYLTSNFNSGYCFPQGNTTVIYTATDAANNSKTCSFVVTVSAAGDNFCKGTPGTGLTREVWNNIAGASVINLTSNANYPNSPTSASLNAASIGPVNIADNYGTRVRGYITPATTGTYKFYVYGDDETQLFLSTNNQSANKVMIANVPDWTNVAELYKYTNQASANKTLTAGQNYYVELLQKEAAGGDHWGIYWIPPGTTTPVQIPLQFLAPISTNCTPPACATLVSPANNATGLATAAVPLTWNSSANATSYDIYLATANPPTTIVASNVTGTSYTATNLQAGTAYFWYVVPKNTNGSATGCNASIFKFTTVSPCSNLTNGGTIGKSCLNNQVSLTNVTLPTGGSGTLEYVWMKSTTSCDFSGMTEVANSNSPALTVTSPSVTTYYIRCSRRAGCTEYTGESNCITVNANECNFIITCTGNMISNFGFENGFTGYLNYNNVATITTDAFLGTKAVKLCADGGVITSYSATPGKTYTFKAFAKKTEVPAYSDLFIQFFDSNWNLLAETYKPVTTSTYTEYTLTATAPAGTSYIQLMLWAGPGGCTYTDNWCLTESATACNTSVLFVVGNTTLGSGDLAIKNRLQSLGYSVTLKDDNNVQTSDANGKGLVLISSTVNASYITSKFRNVTVPVMLHESYLFDDMKMTGTSQGTDYGVNSNISQTNILLNHALTTGVTGTVSVFSGGTYVNWGKPGSAAIKAAVIPNNTTKHMIFAYDTGASMVGLTAPGKRIGFFLENTNASSLTANGWKLFDNAVKWATGCNFGQALTAAESTVFEVSAYNELRKARIELVNNTGLTNDYFILERLNDSGTFEEIEYVEAEQTDNLTHLFSFYDEDPAEGSNYYRIRLINLDGTEAISEVQKVVFGGLSKVVAYPNPARENIILDLTPFEGQEATIYLYDLRGTEVLRIVKTDFEDTSLEMDISHLADGIYTIRVHNSLRRDEIIPIVIQH